MKMWVFSDLHTEMDRDRLHKGRGPTVPNADVAVVAGDIAAGGLRDAVEWLKAYVLLHMPCVFVPGNHEFYHSSMMEEREQWMQLYRTGELPSGLHLLDCDSVDIGSVRFLGSTLWTDFNLYGEGKPGIGRAMDAAALMMNDFAYIDWRMLPQRELLTPDHTRRLHKQALGWITSELAEPRAKTTVVVSHHAPSPSSVHQRFLESVLSPAFVSDLDDLIRSCGPDLWVHGHVHDSFDYIIGRTRVLCNPKGYGDENRHFDPELVVELEI